MRLTARLLTPFLLLSMFGGLSPALAAPPEGTPAIGAHVARVYHPATPIDEGPSGEALAAAAPAAAGLVVDARSAAMLPSSPSILAILAKNRRPAMRKERRLMWTLAVSAVALGSLITAPHARAQAVVKIAAGVPLTGPLAKQGQEVANAVKLAVEEWNKKGGVLGKKIEVLEADDQGNPQVGVSAAEKVAADSAVLGAVWGITSVTCIPVSEVLDRVNMVLISPGCTNPKVTDRGLKNVNRTCARDDAQGPAGAMFAVQDLKAKKIAIFDDGTTGPKGAADEVEKKAKALGAQAQRFVVRAGDKDFRAILGTLPKDVDVIYASLWAPEAALIAKQLPDVGLSKVKMIGPDGQFEPVDYVQASGGAAEGNYVTFLAPDMKKVPAAAAFVKAFEAKYGTLSSYGPLAYEAANIILEAVKKVGKADRAAIRDAVRATKNYKGVLGVPISFDDKGDVAGGVIFVYQVKGQGFEQIKTIVVK